MGLAASQYRERLGVKVLPVGGADYWEQATDRWWWAG